MMAGNQARTTAPRMISLDTRSSISKIDREGMLDLVAGFPAQCEEAMQIGQKAAIGTAHGPFPAVVVAGMGGSAIAGDLLRCYLADTIDVPLITVRNYQFPRAVGQGAPARASRSSIQSTCCVAT